MCLITMVDFPTLGTIVIDSAICGEIYHRDKTHVLNKMVDFPTLGTIVIDSAICDAGFCTAVGTREGIFLTAMRTLEF